MNKPRTQYWTKKKDGTKGKKRLLLRNKKGQIKDNQSWKRVSQLDQKKRSKEEKLSKKIHQLIALAYEILDLAL